MATVRRRAVAQISNVRTQCPVGAVSLAGRATLCPANPFAGVKVKSHTPRGGLDVSRSFSEGEWLLIRTVADGIEWSYGWSVPAAHRLRFLLDFGYAAVLRAGRRDARRYSAG